VLAVTTAQSVPLRALALSLLAMTAAVSAAVFWPQDLLDREILASVLALVPALLLAHYRGWASVSILLGVGMVVLCVVHLSLLHFGLSFRGSPFMLFVVAPYLAIALGAGWFGEVRQYQAELRATQLQLVQSEKLDSIGRIAAGVAHEVKNPLMTILTGVKILSKRLATGDETTRTLLQDMKDAVERADKIIGGLLSYSRDRELDLAPADFNAIVERSLQLVKHELDKGRIRVVKDLDGSLPMVTLDEFKIQQVFVNVLTNALHAMGADGEIHLRTSMETLARGRFAGYRHTDRYRPGERIAMVQIDDSGPGIREEHLGRIFDPFFTTKPTGLGTGLGLSVSRQIVEMHGGMIEISNRELGGARVTMIFRFGDIAQSLPLRCAAQACGDGRA
jgi:signal transduction histidine kinase